MNRWMKYALCLALLLALAVPARGYEDDEVVGSNRDLLAGVNGAGSMISGTDLGYALADAARAAGATELAIVAGGDIAGNLVGGEITWGYLRSALTEDRPLGTAEITPARLKALLEAGCENIVVDETDSIVPEASRSEAFAQPSGFTYEIDGSAPAGERIYRIRLEDGKELDPADDTTILTLTASVHMLSGGYGTEELAAEPLGMTLAEAAIRAMAEGTFGMQTGRRVSFIGTADARIIDAFPVGIIVLAGILIALFRYRQNAESEMTRTNPEMEKGYEKKSVRDLYRR